MARPDPHSVTDDAQPTTRHLEWDAVVEFASKRLTATATLHFKEATKSATPFDLDARALEIDTVTDLFGAALKWEALPIDPILGSPLRLHVPAGVLGVRLSYRTGPDASALQWLEPSQTHGGKQPYLFSQCQAIHARSLIPCQDTPARRVSYRASMSVPAGLIAVMAAAPLRSEVKADRTTFHFEMPQVIPPYLLAFAVGELASKDLSPRSRVWSEPGLLEAAAWEFADVERHLTAAESLFGAYDWERFDLLVMPPSFPYGGMENPRLTFLTPTLLAGDRSMVNVVAHELAHSWTGNLVTNVNAEHFWLNEGFTVFAERRILEALEGREVSEMHAALGRNDLDDSVARFEKARTPELTKLRTNLTGIDPDEAFSVVPYEKGYLLLRALEAAAGREKFDGLLKSWLTTHRFGSVNTDDFISHFETSAPGLLAKVNALKWIDSPGVPSDAPRATSARLDAVKAMAGKVPEVNEVSKWSAIEWQLFLEWSPRTLTADQLAMLDSRFHFSTAKNTEVHVAWLLLSLQCGSKVVLPQVEALIGRVGRMKYLKPLFAALHAQPATAGFAKQLFEKNNARLHPIARQVISNMLGK
ncbi:MAG: M1 family metallopeptidase [Archangium sp.]|nr:M1 family metallopeptidase [Archangium sp.]MDP3574569.1 M1 family metallopeptidase [Archangium sp.]